MRLLKLLILWISLFIRIFQAAAASSVADDLWDHATAGPLAPAMFVFGASMVDVGTTNYIPNFPSAAKFPPYGETFFHHPTGRFSDGLITPDFLAMDLGLPLLPPFLEPGANFSQGANFACASSGLLETTSIELHVISFSHQIEQFTQLAASWEQSKLHDSIFLINFGTNDLGAYDGHAPVGFVQQLLGVYERGLKLLYHAGARRFAVMGLAPLGCRPGSRARRAVQNKEGCNEELNNEASQFNAGLESLLEQLGRDLQGMQPLYFNAYGLFQDITENGDKYGFVETESSCCGAGPYNSLVDCGKPVPQNLPYNPVLCDDPSQFLFWDIHPSQRGHSLQARAIWSGNSSLIRPINLQTAVSSRNY